MNHYAYVLLSRKDDNFCTGYASDLIRRLKQHRDGKVFSTKGRLPMKLVYYEVCLTRQNARAREKYLKSGMGKRYLGNRLTHYLDNL